MTGATKKYRIGLSFSGQVRAIVEPVAEELAKVFGPDAILYDKFHEAEFARGDLAFHLPKLYREQCDLVVAIFDRTYSDREWTSLEWNAIFALHKSKLYQSVMLLTTDHESGEGLFGLDGAANISGRAPSEVSALILERLAINEGHERSHYQLAATPDVASVHLRPRVSDSLLDELYLIRRERNGRARRKGLRAIADRLDKELKPTATYAECTINTWKQLLFEARYYDEYRKAAAKLRDACENAANMTLSARDRWIVIHAVAEAAVDLSQTAPRGVETNKLVSLLNLSIKYIGALTGPAPESIHSSHARSEMLATRAKCRRALAALMSRRLQPSKEVSEKLKALRRDALSDATKASEAHKSSFALLEQALSLFANASSPTSDMALAGLAILEELARSPRNVFASYELVRQFNLRHRYSEAMQCFYSINEAEQDRRRFNANLTLFVRSIIGLHYSSADSSEMSLAVPDAINWLEDVISTEHHRANDVIDYCYLLAIAGEPIAEFVAPLREINKNGAINWTMLSQLAYHVGAGTETLSDALLLGLEDPAVWNRMGTLHFDFARDATQAIVFYDQAIHIHARSPIYHFNKARALAYGMHDYVSARYCLEQARRLTKYEWGWFKVNADRFDELERDILKNCESRNAS